MNPVLEKLRFWAGLEWIVWRVTGVRHREDTSVRGQGPGPAWLSEYRPVSRIPKTAAHACSPNCPKHATCPRRITSSTTELSLR